MYIPRLRTKSQSVVGFNVETATVFKANGVFVDVAVFSNRVGLVVVLANVVLVLADPLLKAVGFAVYAAGQSAHGFL